VVTDQFKKRSKNVVKEANPENAGGNKVVGSSLPVQRRSHGLFETPVLSANLRRNSVRGATIVSASRVGSLALRFGSTAILARILAPQDFGLVAMTAVVSGFFYIFMDVGLTSATIQREEISHRQISTLFWINVSLGCLIAAIVAAIAPLVAAFYDEPRVTGIAQALALSFVLGGLAVQHQALLRRHMRFKTLAVNEIASTMIGVASGIVMAAMGCGYWSLVGIVLASATTKLIGLWIVLRWIPCLPVRGSGVRPMLKFGSDILGFGIVNYFARQADTILIGRFFGALPLAYYEKAYSLLLLPIGQINAPLSSVAVPALSRCRSDPENFKRYYLSLVQIVCSLGIPLVAGIAIFADQIVLIWLGSQWRESASLFRLLAIAAVIGGITNPLGWLQISLGQTSKYRNLGIANSLIIVLAFCLGLPFGPHGVAAAYSIAMAVNFIPYWYLALKGTPVSLISAFGAMLPPFVSCVVAAIPPLLIASLGFEGVQSWIATGFAAFSYFATYSLVLLVGFRKWGFFRGILDEFRSVKS
jgi:O-antigen/teichoic acid export membrane protein